MYAYLGGALACCIACASSFWYGLGLGEDRAHGQALREERIAAKATEAAASAAAHAIAGIEIKNTTIRQTLERVTRENTIFTDCRSGPDAVRLLNATPGVEAASAVAPGGDELREGAAARR